MALEAIKKFVRDQNRPYSANDVFENLHKQFGKSEVQKSLDTLVSQKKVLEKTYNKQKVYCVKQPDDSSGSQAMDDELREFDRKISDLNDVVSGIDDKVNKHESELKALLSTLTTEDAKKEKQKLEEQIESLKEKLEKLSGGPNGPKAVGITPEARSEILLEKENMAKEYKKRKRFCMDIIEAIMEGYPKSRKHLIEELKIETDEDVGFKLE